MNSLKRRILHIDMDAFFAAVEEKRRPELVGKPVIIGGRGDPSRRGVVSTANYEARRYGVHSAMPLKTAYRLCPHAAYLPVDYDAYSAASHEFKNVLTDICPRMESGGIDEAYLDITDIDDTSENISRRIKIGIREKTGLTCSIGIAPNKLIAKIASDMKKPDGLTILTEEDINDTIWPLPVRKLYGVGPKTEARLHEINIATIGQIAGIPQERLITEFGDSYGRYLHDAARGIDESPLITHWEPKSISREITFQTDVKDWQVIAKTLAALTKDVIADMVSNGYKARTFTVKVRFSYFRTLTRATTLHDFIDSEEEVRKAVFSCLKKIQLDKRVRLLGVRASNFTGPFSQTI
jgi:DNA polymerase-4